MGRMKYSTAPMADDHSSSRTTNVRKIDNGYIVSESVSRNGTYHHTERYCETAPDIEAMEHAHETNAGAEGMREAKKELQRK